MLLDLLAFELVGAVAGPNGRRQRVAAGLHVERKSLCIHSQSLAAIDIRRAVQFLGSGFYAESLPRLKAHNFCRLDLLLSPANC
jgi:hypothetical protein